MCRYTTPLKLSAMTSIELVKNIYEKAVSDNKKNIWLSEKQESFLWSLLHAENKIKKGDSKQYIATILPSGEWTDKLTYGEATKIGEELLKRVYIVKPPHYIRREGFQAKKIIVI